MNFNGSENTISSFNLEKDSPYFTKKPIFKQIETSIPLDSDVEEAPMTADIVAEVETVPEDLIPSGVESEDDGSESTSADDADESDTGTDEGMLSLPSNFP